MNYFRSQPIKILLTVAQSLYETNFNYEDPWDDAEDNDELLKEKSAWLGLDTDYDDMEFMAAFMNINDVILEKLKEGGISKQQAITEITLPKQKTFKIFYEIWGPATLTEKYSTTWQSYDEKWVNESLRHQYNNGEFNYYDGNYEEYETDNFDPDNFDITYTEKIRESKKPILSKLVVENTKEMLHDLDKETLIELRNLINQRLSSF